MSDIEQMRQRAADIDDIYRERGPGWGLREYTEGAMGDLGDLMKLVQAQHGLRPKDDIEARIEHEINDLQWSILMMYRAIGKKPLESFMQWADELEQRIAGS